MTEPVLTTVKVGLPDAVVTINGEQLTQRQVGSLRSALIMAKFSLKYMDPSSWQSNHLSNVEAMLAAMDKTEVKV